MSCSHQPTLMDRSCDERCKEWMRCKRPRLELGMELNAYEPGMIRYLHDLRQPAVRRPAGNHQTVLSKLARVTDVHFIPVPVTFADRGRPINFGDAASGRKHGGIRAEPHRAAEIAAFRARFNGVTFC